MKRVDFQYSHWIWANYALSACSPTETIINRISGHNAE